MNIPRRRVLQFAVAALPVGPGLAHAQMQPQNWPARPVRLIVAVAPGGGADIVARLMGQWLGERLGQPVVVENHPGAGNNVGTEVVVRAAPDGYTLLSVAVAAAINATLYDGLSFNYLRDIAPVGATISVPNVLYIHPSLSAKTLPEFIAYAKMNPGKLNMASAGNGTSSHMAGELFKMMAGVDMVHVPYRGQGPAFTDLLAGQIQVMFATTPGTTEFATSGALRALAVTTVTRAEALPDTPTIGEFLPGYEASQWYGIGAPRDTPPEIIARLNREINAILADPANKARIAAIGGTSIAGTPAAFGKLVAEETEKWAKVVRFSGAKPD